MCQHERHHVNFTQCTVRDNGIIREALVFLVVSAVHRVGSRSGGGGGCLPNEQDHAPKMLDSGTDSAFLKTVDVSRSENSGQVRVLGEGLETLQGGVSSRRETPREGSHSATKGVLKERELAMA